MVEEFYKPDYFIKKYISAKFAKEFNINRELEHTLSNTIIVEVISRHSNRGGPPFVGVNVINLDAPELREQCNELSHSVIQFSDISTEIAIGKTRRIGVKNLHLLDLLTPYDGLYSNLANYLYSDYYRTQSEVAVLLLYENKRKLDLMNKREIIEGMYNRLDTETRAEIEKMRQPCTKAEYKKLIAKFLDSLRDFFKVCMLENPDATVAYFGQAGASICGDTYYAPLHLKNDFGHRIIVFQRKEPITAVHELIHNISEQTDGEKLAYCYTGRKINPHIETQEFLTTLLTCALAKRYSMAQGRVKRGSAAFQKLTMDEKYLDHLSYNFAYYIVENIWGQGHRKYRPKLVKAYKQVVEYLDSTTHREPYLLLYDIAAMTMDAKSFNSVKDTILEIDNKLSEAGKYKGQLDLLNRLVELNKSKK